MKKTLSFPYQLASDCAGIFFDHSLLSLYRSLSFFVSESRPPTFLRKAVYALGSSMTEVDFGKKMRVIMGLMLMSNADVMVLSKTGVLPKQSLGLMFNSSAIGINLGFLVMAGRGIGTKVHALMVKSLDVNDGCTDIKPSFFDSVAAYQMVEQGRVGTQSADDPYVTSQSSIYCLFGLRLTAELLCFNSAVAIICFASLDLANNVPEEGSGYDYYLYIGLVKTASFMMAHLIMTVENHLFESMEDQDQLVMRSCDNSLWYVNDSESDHYSHFLDDYRNSGFCTNFWTFCYTLSSVLMKCDADGPQGPSGDWACTQSNWHHQLMFSIQALINIWLSAPLIQSGIRHLDDALFPYSDAFNQWTQEQMDSLFNTECFKKA